MTQDTRWAPLRQENDPPRMSRRPPVANPWAIYPELRYRRAQALVSFIMQIVGPAICEHTERKLRRNVTQQLMETFFDEGVEVITDADRKAAGLAPRGISGMTAYELHALEMHRLELMMRPIHAIVPTIMFRDQQVSEKDKAKVLSRLGTGEPPTL